MDKVKEEILKARSERKAKKEDEALRFKKAQKKKKADDAKSAKDIKIKYPKQFKEFNRLKELRARFEAENVDEKLHWLQIEMIYGQDWIWDGIDNPLTEYSDDEQKIISVVASKFYEGLERRLKSGENLLSIPREELIRLIEEAGIDTYERDSNIYWNTYTSVHHSTRVYELMNERLDEEKVPVELKY